MNPLLRTTTVLLILTSVALAGCADSKSQSTTCDENDASSACFQPPTTLKGTGVLYGVTVDSAIRPLAGVAVEAIGPDATPHIDTTDADGRFSFSNLEPGTYIIKASKLGYFTTQTSHEVIADALEPGAVSVLLEADPESIPYATQLVFDGYVECSISFYQACGAIDQYSELLLGSKLTNDNLQVRYPLDRVPMWTQSEMIWDSTQAAGNRMSLSYSYGTCDQIYLCDHQVKGSSPLTLTANETMAATFMAEATDPENPLYIRVFPAGVDGSEQCIDGVVCFNGAGAAYQQSFRIITHVFYGYTPPEGWTFVETQEVPAPLG